MTHTGKKDDALEGEILGRDEITPSKRTHWAVYVSLVLAIFIAGLFSAPYGERALTMLGVLESEKPAIDGAKLARDIAAQNAKIESLSDVLSALEKYENAQSDEVKDLAKRLRVVEMRPVSKTAGPIVAEPVDLGPLIARLEALEVHSTHPIGIDLGDIEARLTALEQRDAQISVTDEAVVSLKAMTQAAAYKDEIDALALEYSALIPVALRADARGTEEGLWSHVRGWAKSLIVVRPTEDLGGDTLAARLGRAEHALAEGTALALAAALAELHAVEGPAATVLAPWMAKAQAVYDASLPPADSGVSE